MDGLNLAEEQPQKPLVQVLRSDKFDDDNSMQIEDDENTSKNTIGGFDEGKSDTYGLKLADSELSSQIS
jgi:hypothetical protein